MRDLLFEIGTEELPAGFLQPAMDQLAGMFARKAEKLNLTYAAARTFSTPRRLVLLVTELEERQKDSQEELLGPSKQAAFDADGRPTKAAEGFARSKGVDVDRLQLISTPKGEYVQLIRQVKGETTASLLPAIFKELLSELSFPKSMKWGSNQSTFARPIQWLLALFGNDVIRFEYEGIVSGNQSRGHRFLAPDSIVVERPSAYVPILADALVMVDAEQRRRQVVTEITTALQGAGFPDDARVSIDEGLLDTVTNLVEYPFGVCGRFDKKFLQVPDDVLITSMREHQKYFPVVDGQEKLLPGFVAVNNTRVRDIAVTRAGHERVLRARLEDAYFFFQSDRKKRLADRLEALQGIIFQAKLGSMREKADRVVKLTRLLTEQVDPRLGDDACRAALLCKADLTTDMVGEFPSLQGVMGSAYAEHDQERPDVVLAIREHYMPLRAGAALPTAPIGAIVGLADRIDTIAGCFGIGQIPTGTTDPFGLRRLVLAVINIIVQRGYRLSLTDIFRKALALYGERVDGSSTTVEQIIAFVKARFSNDCISRAMDARAVDGVCSVAFDDVVDSLARIVSLSEIKQRPSFDVLAGSFKRIRNITKDNQDVEIDEGTLLEPAEQQLYALFKRLSETSQDVLAAENYAGFLELMLELKEPVDQFFDDVMVMVDDDRVRRNRLNLLTAIGSMILAVGDISKMHGGS